MRNIWFEHIFQVLPATNDKYALTTHVYRWSDAPQCSTSICKETEMLVRIIYKLFVWGIINCCNECYNRSETSVHVHGAIYLPNTLRVVNAVAKHAPHTYLRGTVLRCAWGFIYELHRRDVRVNCWLWSRLSALWTGLSPTLATAPPQSDMRNNCITAHICAGGVASEGPGGGSGTAL